MHSIQKPLWLAGALVPLLGFVAVGCASPDRESEIPSTWVQPTGSQADELKARAQGVRDTLPPEVLAVVDDADKKLADSDALERALKTGQTAPDFTLPDAFGHDVSLASLREKGPVVLTFYRGHW